jgi:pre-mRNA-processing factor 17
MNFLSCYGSDEDDTNREDLKSNINNSNNNNNNNNNIAPNVYRASVMSAPFVSSALVSISAKQFDNSNLVKHNQKEVLQNPKANILLAPVVGPAHPFRPSIPGIVAGGKQSFRMGHIESASIDDFTFDEQFTSYQRSGFAVDSTTNEILGSYDQFVNSQSSKNPGSTKRKKSSLPEDLGDESSGPWAPIHESEQVLKKEKIIESGNIINKNNELEENEVLDSNSTIHILEPDEEDEKWEKVNERKMSYLLPARPLRGSTVSEAKSIFHGKSAVDYQGRSWIVPPSGLRPDDGDHECFIPKKCIKKYTGHTKGVQEIELFPKTGHLLLSGSLDSKCKIWDVNGDKNVLRTYMGHTEAVRSINMSGDGSSFLSSGFDRYIRMWDVETGQAKGTYSNRKMAYQVRYYPIDNNVFLCASSDNKVYQWDARTGQVCQEYNHHLQPCNTITFIDEGRKFVTTSDDKKMLVWEYDIPVPIKYIAEADMHSMPAVSVHPSNNFLAGQSMDNTISVYTCGDKVMYVYSLIYF